MDVAQRSTELTQMLAPLRRSRKTAFAAALDLAEQTQGDWARERGIAAETLSRYLNGHTGNGIMDDAVDAFIAKYLPHVEIEERIAAAPAA